MISASAARVVAAPAAPTTTRRPCPSPPSAAMPPAKKRRAHMPACVACARARMLCLHGFVSARKEERLPTPMRECARAHTPKAENIRGPQ
eukprot:6190321-Pleurochrysis_carterae.AAC.2